MKKKFTTPLFFIKWFNFEYWPFWLFYAPMFFYSFLLAIRSRSLSYFTSANPCMKFGGAFDEKKMGLLKKLDQKLVPLSTLIPRGLNFLEVEKQINQQRLNFPLIAKPNIGERGINVEKIEDNTALKHYLAKQHYDTLLQEYIDYNLELGIFYYRYPDGSKDEITSIVKKEFLAVTGNGQSTLGELLSANTRARFRLSYLKEKYLNRWDEIIPLGASLMVEPIGNHNRGTKFLDARHLINNDLLRVFRQIVQPLDGFFFGRFDIKVKNLDDLYEGKNIKILELNGVNSEPAHIYDPKINIFQAYRSIVRHMNIIYRISRQNRQRGAIDAPFLPMFWALIRHLFPSWFHTREKPGTNVTVNVIS